MPARRFVFNEHGGWLALTIAIVALLALALGARYAVRSGFCNSLCPVLPVELLYGQAPLLPLQRGRCDTCTVCVARGCLVLTPGKAFTQAMGPSRRSGRWLATPLGLFVAAMPGFIVGYSVLSDGPLASAPMVYATTLGASAASVALVAVLVFVARVPWRVLLPALAAVAGGTYYWFAGPTIARACRHRGACRRRSRRPGSGWRWHGGGMVVAWWWRALTPTPRPPYQRSTPTNTPTATTAADGTCTACTFAASGGMARRSLASPLRPTASRCPASCMAA